MTRLVTRVNGTLQTPATSEATQAGTGTSDAVRNALDEEADDREAAEQQDQQDQQRQPAGIDPEEQAAEDTVAVTLDGDFMAGHFAEREADQHCQEFDAAKRHHDRGCDREGPHVGGEQKVANCTHCCDFILSGWPAISSSRCNLSSSSSFFRAGHVGGNAGHPRNIAAMARPALTMLSRVEAAGFPAAHATKG